jgi:hypothetical protein
MFRLSLALFSLIIACEATALDVKPKYDMDNSDSPCSKLRVLIEEQEFAAVVHLMHETNPNKCRTKSGYTLLHVAAVHDNAVAIKGLVEYKTMDIDIQNSAGDTPLHEAATSGSVHAVACLLQHGANPLALDSHGLTPRQQATMFCANPRTCQRLKDILQGAELILEAKNSNHIQSTSH